MNDQSSRPLAPDDAAIERHLDILFGYLEGLVPVRLFSEKGTPNKPQDLPFVAIGPELVQTVQRLAPRAAASFRAVYVVPGAVAAPGRAGAEDILASGVLLVDLDHGDVATKRRHLERHIGPASFVVASGGRTEDGQERLHLYWRLTEAATGGDLRTLVRLRAIVAERAGGDLSFKSVHQPIRVAGTIHGKNGVQRLVRIVEDLQLEYELTDLAERVRDLPEEPSSARGRTGACGFAWDDGPSIDDLMTSRVHAGGRDRETRYSALTRIIGHWIRQVRHRRATLEEAWEAVRDHNVALIVPPWPEPRLRREFLALLRVDVARNGPMPSADDPQEAVPPPLSEDAIAADFVARQGGAWRHVAKWGAWLRWSGAHWARDDTRAVLEAIRQVARAATGPDTRPSDAKRLGSEKTVRAVERIASADPRIAARVGDWDADPFLLNTPAAIVHLETGELIAHDPGRLLTQIASASPGPASHLWLGFIDDVTGGDSELGKYLARLFGYCLSGSTEEQVFAFLHGPGANGKSVLLQACSKALGSYAAAAPLGTFMASRNDAHPTDLAGLVGKRLVTVTETEAGRAWAESRIKAITGGDPIRARFMNRDFFEFMPTFKLVIAGNHRPRLSGVGEAMRRRLHLVPFTVTIPPERRDKRLLERLLEERDGILGWMIDGHAEWRRIGLSPPARVLLSAEEYFDDEDLVGQWIQERCLLGPACRGTARALFHDWSEWARSTGVEPGSQKSLGDGLRERGCMSGRFGGQRGWIGIALRRGAAGDAGAE